MKMEQQHIDDLTLWRSF